MAKCPAHKEVELGNSAQDRGITVVSCDNRRSLGRCALGGWCVPNSSNYIVYREQHGGSDLYDVAARHGIQIAE